MAEKSCEHSSTSCQDNEQFSHGYTLQAALHVTPRAHGTLKVEKYTQGEVS